MNLASPPSTRVEGSDRFRTFEEIEQHPSRPAALAGQGGVFFREEGGVAVGDGIVQQALGHGLAARVSARLGEGVLNGIMTARFGIAAISVCRPLPFIGLDPPRFSDVAGELIPSRDHRTDPA